jgi:hypothetical protein
MIYFSSFFMTSALYEREFSPPIPPQSRPVLSEVEGLLVENLNSPLCKKGARGDFLSLSSPVRSLAGGPYPI